MDERHWRNSHKYEPDWCVGLVTREAEVADLRVAVALQLKGVKPTKRGFFPLLNIFCTVFAGNRSR